MSDRQTEEQTNLWELNQNQTRQDICTLAVGGSSQTGVGIHDAAIHQLARWPIICDLENYSRFLAEKVNVLSKDGFVGSRAAGRAVCVPGHHGGGHRDRPVGCGHPCYPQVPSKSSPSDRVSLVHHREQEVYLDKKSTDANEKLSWDLLSSALPVMTASEDELSWFGWQNLFLFLIQIKLAWIVFHIWSPASCITFGLLTGSLVGGYCGGRDF